MRTLDVAEMLATAGGSVVESLPEDGFNIPDGGPGFYGSFGFSAGECALLGVMAGVSAGLVASGACAMASVSVGGATLPVCATAGSVLAPVVGAGMAAICNDASGR